MGGAFDPEAKPEPNILSEDTAARIEAEGSSWSPVAWRPRPASGQRALASKPSASPVPTALRSPGRGPYLYHSARSDHRSFEAPSRLLRLRTRMCHGRERRSDRLPRRPVPTGPVRLRPAGRGRGDRRPHRPRRKRSLRRGRGLQATPHGPLLREPGTTASRSGCACRAVPAISTSTKGLIRQRIGRTTPRPVSVLLRRSGWRACARGRARRAQAALLPSVPGCHPAVVRSLGGVRRVVGASRWRTTVV